MLRVVFDPPVTKSSGQPTRDFAFLGDLGAIPQHILVLAGMWYLCYWLYRHKIFLKI